MGTLFVKKEEVELACEPTSQRMDGWMVKIFVSPPALDESRPALPTEKTKTNATQHNTTQNNTSTTNVDKIRN